MSEAQASSTLFVKYYCYLIILICIFKNFFNWLLFCLKSNMEMSDTIIDCKKPLVLCKLTHLFYSITHWCCEKWRISFTQLFPLLLLFKDWTRKLHFFNKNRRSFQHRPTLNDVDRRNANKMSTAATCGGSFADSFLDNSKPKPKARNSKSVTFKDCWRTKFRLHERFHGAFLQRVFDADMLSPV
jgi:hypothetical protein